MDPPLLLVDRLGRLLAILDRHGADELWLRVLQVYKLSQQRWQCVVEILDAAGQVVRQYAGEAGLARYTFELAVEAAVHVGQRLRIQRDVGRVLLEPVM